jgi:DNA-binding NtrC family response regulator
MVRVLMVDDDAALRKALTRAFAVEYDLCTAAGGEEALEILQASPPFEVIITDLRMPGMSGTQFVSAAKKIAPLSVYIMLTGNYDSPTVASLNSSEQLFRILYKPCKNIEIRRAIEEAYLVFQQNISSAETCRAGIAVS